MGPLKLGTLLLDKYRVDRFHEHGDGIGFYDAVDTTRACPVRVRVRRGGFPVGAPGSAVLDVVRRDGFMFLVEADAACAPLIRRSKHPPPLPRPRAPEIEIPIFDEDLVVEDEPPRAPAPPPPPTPEAELDMEITVDLAVAPFERAMRSQRRSRWGLAILSAATVTGIVGWLAGNVHQPDVSAAAAIAPPPAPSETTIQTPPALTEPQPVAAEPAPTASEASSATPKHRKRPLVDPLTL